jgi:hypothetical protein
MWRQSVVKLRTVFLCLSWRAIANRKKFVDIQVLVGEF